MRNIILSEFADFTAYNEIYYQDLGNLVVLHSDKNGELGYFEKWYDAEMQGRQYIAVNNEVIYLDSIYQL
jgi:hypothetical protein